MIEFITTTFGLFNQFQGTSLRNILTILFFLFSSVMLSQENDSRSNKGDGGGMYISMQSGAQMSGIKDEDFLISNFTPLFNFTYGNWYHPLFGVQFGYKGFYFNYIEHSFHHYYSYVYGDFLVNALSLAMSERQSQVWELRFYLGGGLFYNNFYKKTQFCSNVGMQNGYCLNSALQLTIDVTAIIGWDIYQGNRDILPGFTLGATYSLNAR